MFALSLLAESPLSSGLLRTHAVEDGSKLVGIASWLAFAVTASYLRVPPARASDDARQPSSA
jgi:hypothetical protein